MTAPQGVHNQVNCPAISVCMGSPCIAAGSRDVLQAVRAICGTEAVSLIGTGCMGPCSRGPLVRVRMGGIEHVYAHQTPQSAAIIVRELLAGGHPREGRIPGNFPFLARQRRIVLANCGVIDPEDLESARAAGAYETLHMVLNRMNPQQVCTEISASGLRGRGGGGYPTGTKWAMVARAKGRRKFVVANGDEGDPGAFMDRTLMESDPHRLLEGMAIAGFATGADQGYIYVRGEYPLAAGRLRRAVLQAEKAGFLGRRIMDSGFSFRIRIRTGAGAFVCGEETALLASIMGRRGQPVIRPPYPSQHGLHGAPTLLNNVETFGCVAPIMSQGAAWFRSIGSPGNSGTKVFSISGDVATVGVMEVPLGTPLRELLAIAGGVTGGTFKAAQTGGASGGCIPAQYLDMPVDFDSLTAIGSIMGSGGLIIINSQRSMPDLARFFMRFCQDESCGKCAPCRNGTRQASRILDMVMAGTARRYELEQLEQLCRLMRDASLCGLGMAAPSPVLSTLRWFRNEYEARLEEAEGPSDTCLSEVHP